MALELCHGHAGSGNGKVGPIVDRAGGVRVRDRVRARVRVRVRDRLPPARPPPRQEQHEIVEAENGRLGVEAYQQGSFDLILMDVQMPIMDGFAATAAIRSREEDGENGDRLPIIGVTAHAMEGDMQRCLDAGMDAYLSKPFIAKDLYALIEGQSTS